MIAIPSELKARVRTANGLMPLKTYEALYTVAAEKKPSCAVEVGTAHGASAIALSMGATSVNSDFRMITIDPMMSERGRGEPSSRSQFGGVEDNANIVRENLARAGLSDVVELFVGTSVEFGESGRVPPAIDLLVLDADGRIDRDLVLFRDSLIDGATIIIDDIRGGPKVTAVEESTRWIDYKHLISEAILSALVEAQLLRLIEIVEATAICELVNKKLWTDQQLIQIALQQYRKLVFTPVSKKTLRDWAMYHADLFDEVIMGRRVLKTFGGPIKLLRSLKKIGGRR